MNEQLQTIVERAWEDRDKVSAQTKGEVRQAVDAAIAVLDCAKRASRRRRAAGWCTNGSRKPCCSRFGSTPWGDRAAGAAVVGQDAVQVRRLGREPLRALRASARFPAAVVRRAAYIAPGVVLMPSFVNIGAYVDEGTMVDTWATVGSCAQIGKNVPYLGRRRDRRSARAVAGRAGDHRGRLLHRRPLRSGRGRDRGEGAVLSMGVFIGASTRSSTGARAKSTRARCRPIRSSCPGRCPASRRRTRRPPMRGDREAVDERTRSKTSINELLRE